MTAVVDTVVAIADTTIVESPQKDEPAWHTAQAWPVVATLVLKSGQPVSANCKVQSVRDSLTVVSLLSPLLGMEIMRMEAGVDSVFVIDKMRRRCASESYATLTALLGEQVSLRMVEAVVTGEILQPGQSVFEISSLGMTLRVQYPTIQYDIAVRVKQVDHKTFTPCAFSDLLY